MESIELHEAGASCKDLLLLEVWDGYELNICKFQNVIHIPMMEIS